MPDRIANPPQGEARPPLLQPGARTDAAPWASPRRNLSPLEQVELGLDAAAADADIGAADHPHLPPLARRIALLARASDWTFVRDLRAMLRAVETRCPAMLDDPRYFDGMARLACAGRAWRRPPEEWRPPARDGRRRFASLVRHLLAAYAVPAFFDAAWLRDDGDADAERRWFVHIGSGQNLRTAEGLPFPLTKLMAHHALAAPGQLSVQQALRWGQVRGIGGTVRLARAVVATRLGMPADDEPFWLTVLRFFVEQPMLDPNGVGPIVDYLHAQRFEPGPARAVGDDAQRDTPPPPPLQPNLTMKGRTAEGLLRQVDAWHRTIGRATAGRHLRWRSCGIPGFERTEGEPGSERTVFTEELLSGDALRQEGHAMSHCAATYATSCASGRCAVFSLREEVGGEAPCRRLTVEVFLPGREIAQARGFANRPPDRPDERLLRAWAREAGLVIAPYVFRV